MKFLEDHIKDEKLWVLKFRIHKRRMFDNRKTWKMEFILCDVYITLYMMSMYYIAFTLCIMYIDTHIHINEAHVGVSPCAFVCS